eukprot:9451523-Lingulodinium_polyedra.AAC.1
MENTPPVLSLGKRCTEDGCSFVRLANKRPFMFFRNREAIVLKVQRRVPYLDSERKRYTVDRPEFEKLIGLVHAGSNFP